MQIILFLLLLVVFPFAVLYSLNSPNVILEQGLAHRIFYFHVPVAWVALYAPLFSTLFGIVFLVKKNLKYDILSVSMNSLALFFGIGVLFSGPIWAYSAWGTLWDWTDSRLQSFFVLVISLLAYFLLRSFIIEPYKRARLSSFLSILCSINAVLTWGAIRWMENPGNHPGSVLGKSGMDSDMRISFWLAVFAYHILFLNLFILLQRKTKIDFILEEIRANQL